MFTRYRAEMPRWTQDSSLYQSLYCHLSATTAGAYFALKLQVRQNSCSYPVVNSLESSPRRTGTSNGNAVVKGIKKNHTDSLAKELVFIITPDDWVAPG